jgi:hypothetical protein
VLRARAVQKVLALPMNRSSCLPEAGHGRKREVVHELPHRPNLRHLRRQARELHRVTGGPLQAAQHRIARSYGFPSWPRLKATIEAGEIVRQWMRRPLGKREFEASRDAGTSPTAAEILPALELPPT